MNRRSPPRRWRQVMGRVLFGPGEDPARMSARWQQLGERLSELETRVDSLSGSEGIQDKRLDEAEERLGLIEGTIARLDHLSGHLETELARSRLHEAIAPTMAWIERSDIPTADVVSVVMPTRNRKELARRAIRSLVEQTYPNWELIVVDDGSTDETRSMLETLRDDRIRVLSGEGRGVAAARNRALDMATGSVVAYLDDDNEMHPGWLRAVIWAFTGHADHAVLYGARIVEEAEWRAPGSGSTPIHFEPYSRERLLAGNFIDIGTVAHRRSRTLLFDEALSGLEDWELLLRLTEREAPLLLPVIALFYGTSATNRLTEREDLDPLRRLVRERFAT